MVNQTIELTRKDDNNNMRYFFFNWQFLFCFFCDLVGYAMSLLHLIIAKSGQNTQSQ